MLNTANPKLGQFLLALKNWQLGLLFLAALGLYLLGLNLVAGVLLVIICGLTLFKLSLYKDPDFVIKCGLGSFFMVFFSFCGVSDLVVSNSGSHFALVKAMGDNFSFEIGPFMDYTIHFDYSSPKPGLFYTDRPPGTAWLALIPYTIGKYILEPFFKLWPLGSSFSNHDGVIWVLLIPAFLGALTVILLFNLARMLGASRQAGVMLALIFGSCTIVLKYSSILYSHMVSTFFILFVTYLTLKLYPPLNSQLKPLGRRRLLVILLLGFCLGYSIVVEYTNVLPVLALLIYIAYQQLKQHNIEWGALVGAGVAFSIPILALMTYNAICFGSPFVTSYTYNAVFPWARNFSTTFVRFPLRGLFDFFLGYTSDTADQSGGLLGLLVISPTLIFGLWGWYFMWKSFKNRGYQAITFLFLGIILPMLLLMATHLTYFGGDDRDPRYILVILPFLALPLAWWWDDYFMKLTRRAKRRVGNVFLLLLILSFLSNFYHTLLSFPFRYGFAAYMQVNVDKSIGFNLDSLSLLLVGGTLLVLLISARQQPDATYQHDRPDDRQQTDTLSQ